MSEWISVEDRLPDRGKKVLCFIDDKKFEYNGPYFISEYFDNYWDVCNDTYPNSSNYSGFVPTHWMPLPEIPKK